MDFQTKSMRWDNARRTAMNYFISGLSILATVIVIAPLVAILSYLIYKGASSLNLAFFTNIPAPVGEQGGGMANSIVGSGIILALASLMGIPVGIAAGVYLAEFGQGTLLANAVRFTADVLNGVPSIVMGISVFALLVHGRHFSAFAGGVALAIMMVPTITRTTEEMLATVPHAIREAALGLGVPKWRTAVSVSLRTASPGIRPRSRGDRAVALHRLRQPVLERETQRAHRRTAAADLHLRHFAVR
jgi:phosphate transport system permease protein